MVETDGVGGRRTASLRADARRNQEQILHAAREAVAERGAGVPLEEVARRAEVGIGTLYRRFPDRDALLRAVVLDALARSRAAAERALEEHDGFEALAAYMHAVLDLRVSAVIPEVLDRFDLLDADLGPARDASASAVQRIVDAAHADGSLPAEIGFGDIGTFLVRMSRPLPGAVPLAMNDELAHRHLDVFLAGLRLADPGSLGGRPLSREDLSRFPGQDRDTAGD